MVKKVPTAGLNRREDLAEKATINWLSLTVQLHYAKPF